MTSFLLNTYIFLVGLCIGSFLNVCIYRLPAGRSIVRPASACSQCGTPLRWYDNIPLISYIVLRGRCRTCQAHISPRYPAVELLAGMFALALWLRFGAHPQTAVYFVFVTALLVITFIDIDHGIIPNVISLPGIPVGLALSFFLPHVGWLNSLLGIMLGAGTLLLIAWGYRLLTGKEGMGLGDVKLLGMIGAFTGWQGVVFTILISSLTGTVVGLALMLRAGRNMKMAIPFGPFLAIGAIVFIFFGPEWIEWYLNWPHGLTD